MIAYKATHDFKCFNQEYKVGKTYTSDRMEICKHGFHFCQKMDNVLNYYTPSSNFILLEIEILGKIETNGDKSVTDKLKVLRVIPFEGYTDSMKSRFPIYEYDERNNKISETYLNGNKVTFEYDERGNMISETYPSGGKYTYEYDERSNMISKTYSSGCKYTYEYDERNNRISETYPNGNKYTYEYDERSNMISKTYPDGRKYTYEYDERNNRISETYPNGDKLTYEYAVITEE
jgi:YD repeat-containing protein